MFKRNKQTTNDENVEGEESIADQLKKAERLKRRGKKLMIAGGAIIAAGIVGLLVTKQEDTDN